MAQIAKLTKEDKGHVRALELFIMKEYFEATLNRKWDDLSQEFVDQLGATHKGSFERYLGSGLSFVAKEDGQIVGFVFAQMVEHMSNLPKAVWIENIGVHPSYRRRGIGLQLLKRLATESKKKGAIAVGSDADLVLIDPNEEWTLRAADLHMRTDFNPYEGRRVRGRPVLTLSRGRLIVEQGRFLGEEGWGRFLPQRI